MVKYMVYARTQWNTEKMSDSLKVGSVSVTRFSTRYCLVIALDSYTKCTMLSVRKGIFI